MLVLTRAKSESIMIGDDIEIIVTEISGKKVKLGINAPKRVSVHRKEIYEALKAKPMDSDIVTTPDQKKPN